MKHDTGKKRFFATLWLVVFTAALTMVMTIGGMYWLGFDFAPGAHRMPEDTGEGKLLWTCGMHPWILEEAPGNCPICGMKLTPKRDSEGTGPSWHSTDRKILYWRAPMNPMETYDKPGKSAMGMDLVPVYEDEVVGGGALSIDPVTQQNMGIRTTVVERAPLIRKIRTYGHVTYDETRTAQVNPKISGWIEKIHVDYTGKMVEKGDALFDIYSPELFAAQEEYLSAFRQGRAGDGNHFLVTSARRRLSFFDVPADEIQRIETTGRIEKAMTIRSLFRGVVVMKNIEQGSYVNAGTPVYRIADLSRVWVEAHIYEYELPWVSEGQTAIMTLPYQPGKSFEGKVSYIYPYVQVKTRDVVVRLEFDNPGLSIKPDMYADVQILTDMKGEGMVIPVEAVIRSGKRNVVFVVRESNKFSPREVTLGLSLENRKVQILTGLAPGEVVVTSGQFMLDSESKLKEAVQKMMEANRPANETKASNVKDAFEEDFFDDMEEN